MALISFLLRSSWRIVAIALTTGFLSGGCSAAVIALVSRTLAEGGQSTVLAWSFAGFALVALTTSIVSRVVLVKLSQDAVFALQSRLSRQILATQLNHLERIGSPRLLAILTEDIQTLSTAVSAIPVLCINFAVVIGCMVYISWLSWQIMLMVLLLSLIAGISCKILLSRGRVYLMQAREQQDQLFQHFRTVIEGVKELKLHHRQRQDFLGQDLDVTASQFRRSSSWGFSLFATLDGWGKLIYFFALGLILFVLPHLMAINPQMRLGYVLTFTYLLGPMESVVAKLPFLSKASVSLGNIETLGLSLRDLEELESSPAAATESWQSLNLKGVTCTYPGEKDSEFTLGPIDVTLQPGELVFVVGGNGSGKSTLLKLMTGLYTPVQGQIALDGQLIDRQNREWYRQHFSVIFADFYLFDRLLGIAGDELDAKALKYLRELQLDHKVTVEQGRLSTTALSQGQRKRMALLATLLEDRPIYLFDEWAADQDPVFKEIFYTEFLADLKARGKTIIAISHDDHYFHLADRIIKLDFGKIEYDKQVVQELDTQQA
ncbi:ABC transporter ATP-binding/permease protein YojI [Acaryochloris thomasi RCC1774]|uniref:ABC transporter ATP-binding/permease protein YojI n=1 Tax=Acaryochloris thomasi RCC1774 TaxID=1764569 RepID=A0A2W1JC37_9CYAN|nr:cyclic peptide export ABC transporter [Acaryochloris thomasi]PZD71543.1 ABC transporter ATP-binding/permease protein YojI [Acaryochloris thomasi RCC1774]